MARRSVFPPPACGSFKRETSGRVSTPLDQEEVSDQSVGLAPRSAARLATLTRHRDRSLEIAHDALQDIAACDQPRI